MEEVACFKEALWNASGPSVHASLIFMNALVDELEHGKTFKELELIFEKEEMFTNQLIGFLKEEGGTSSEDQLAFAIKVTKDLEKLSEEIRPETKPISEEENNTPHKTQETASIGVHSTATGAEQHSPVENEKDQGDGGSTERGTG